FIDIVFAFTAVFLVFFGLLAMINVFGLITHADLPDWTWPRMPDRRLFQGTPTAFAFNTWASLYFLGGMVILGRLRKIFGTLTRDTPFQTENARRLRIIGLVLAALQLSELIIWVLVGRHDPERFRFLHPVDLGGIFGIVVMFVLAEVFDEGARMRKDLELTI
ncbi:MAG: DUF2975 domain-containing protein, partial [Alphaproteobacteria bacterium]